MPTCRHRCARRPERDWLTGCYPRRVGLEAGAGDLPVLLPGDAIGLSADEVTIASLLRGPGYATRMVGKWHVGD